MVDAEQVTAPEAEHGEGPVWADWGPGDSGLRYVDMLRGDVLSLDRESGTVSRQHVGTVAAALRPRRDGGMVVALEREFAIVGVDGRVRGLGDIWTDTGIRFNDGGTDPDGRFYCGTMAYDETPSAGSMYRLDPDGSVTRVWGDVTVSNGMAWSPACDVVYYIDTPTGRVDAFDYDPGTGIVVASRRTIVEIPSQQGGPDGMTVDAEGGLWVALWGGSAVHRYSSNGKLEQVVRLPASQVTACAFGGPSLDELYITTSQNNVSLDDQPSAGALFRVTPGVPGLRALPFTG